MKKIKELYFKYKEIINYLIVGVLTTIVSLIVYYACVLTILNPENAIELQIANVLSWIISVAFAYITNRKFVFESKSEKILKEITSFVSSRVLTLLLDMLIMFIMVTLMGVNDKISKLFAQIVVIILNYVFSKIFVFKNKGKEG